MTGLARVMCRALFVRAHIVMTTNNRAHIRVVGLYPMLLAIFAVVVLLFISKDSYLHDMGNHYDSAWFLTCGRAWVNGLLPYADFSDSKGPLLWAIYAVGYVLNRHSYVGVFWLSCVAWSFTLVTAYKTARLYVGNAPACVAALMVALFGLFPALHNETRCEDFALPFVSAALYAVCALLQGGGRRRVHLMSIVVGVSVAATFMLKFNIAAMLAPLALTFVWAARARRWPAVAYMLMGALAVVLPFVIYFANKGILQLFCHEYVWKTLQTTGNRDAQSMLGVLPSACGVMLLLMLLLTCVGVWREVRAGRWPMLLSVAAFFAVCSVGARPYYYTVYAPFVVFAGLMVISLCPAIFSTRARACAVTSLTALLLIGSNLWLHDLRHADTGDFFTQNNTMRANYYALEQIVAQTPNARIVSYTCQSVGTCSGALPACRYWAYQTGSTPDMERDRLNACKQHKADFVLLHSEQKELIAQVRQYGYHLCAMPANVYDCVVLSKRPLPQSLQFVTVSNADVLLKRPIHFPAF